LNNLFISVHDRIDEINSKKISYFDRIKLKKKVTVIQTKVQFKPKNYGKNAEKVKK
jgi:hypothetical protein